MKKSTIIIVDDDSDDREILRDAFLMAYKDADCYLLENGEQLLSYLKQHYTTSPPSLIMLDLNMPGKDGRETLKEIKCSKQFHTVPVIVFTTSSSHRDQQTVYDAGANCIVTKPDTFNKLVELTRSILALWVFNLDGTIISEPHE
jgi:DNA-binding response OmpR family regulator